AAKTIKLESRRARAFTDVIGAFFQDPETAGAIELSWESVLGEIAAFSRTYTPSLPAPTNGTAIPALPASAATKRALLGGLATNGPDRSSGFRTNAGAYNPHGEPVTVTFALVGTEGQPLGSPVTRTAGPNEAFQINDVFAEA